MIERRAGEGNAMHAMRRGAPITAPWALALIPLTLGATIHVPVFGVWIAFAPFLPLLGAWLGAHYGRAALSAALLASPLIAPYYWMYLTDISELSLGAGLETFVLTLFAIAAFDRSGAQPAAGPPVAGWALALGLFAILSGAASVQLTAGNFGAALGVSAPSALPVAAFLLVASGRAGGVATMICAALVCLAAYAASALAPVPLGFSPPTGDVVDLELSWGRFAFPALGLAIPAALVGSLIRPLWLTGAPLATAPGTRPRVLAALLAVFALPLALWGANLGVERWREASADALSLTPVMTRLADGGRAALDLIDPPAAAQDSPPGEEAAADETFELEGIVVTGTRINVPASPPLPTGVTWLMILGGIAFAAGASWPRGAPGLIPTLYAAAAFAVAAVERVVTDGWADPDDPGSAFLELLSYNLDVLLFLIVIGWSFAWFGALSTAYAHAASRSSTRGAPGDEP
jgi:hypothetical protein